MFIQISRETMLLLINNLHKNVRDNGHLHYRLNFDLDKYFITA